MIRLSLTASFEATFELSCYDYWTVVLPPMPEAGPWYAPDVALTRGVFFRERDAHIWAHANLGGRPYSVRLQELPSEPGDEPEEATRFTSMIVRGWPSERNPFATLRVSPDDERSWHTIQGDES